MTDEELDRPATKRDVRDTVNSVVNAAVAGLATKDELAATVAKLAMKDELAEAVAKLATKDELAEAVAKLATKDELRAEITSVRADMELGFTRLMEAILEVKTSIRPIVVEEVRSTLQEVVPGVVRQAVRETVQEEFRIAFGISEEEWRRRVAVLDEKYKELPPRVSAVEDDLEAHKQDFGLHKRPGAP